jgi:choline-sulfatase
MIGAFQMEYQQRTEIRGKLGRREFLGALGAGAAALPCLAQVNARGTNRPNVLFLMTDQQRFDTIRSLGNSIIYTPNFDRLVQRGVTFTNAYSGCPVCVPARYTIRTGCEAPTTGSFANGVPKAAEGQAKEMTSRSGHYLAQTMKALGYRTFGIGKFHTVPWNEELGFDVDLRTEELHSTVEQRKGDAYAAWIAKNHPELDIEGLMGERTDMYYMPQRRSQPAEFAMERWAADRAVEQIRNADPQPYFGFVSFFGPHPPFAPPIPFNRMYDPDRMPNPVSGDLKTDYMDDQIPWGNYLIWAEDINDSHARVLKARYYGTITYIDDCIGRILDAVEARPDADNTVICFFSDHGDHLGDHHAWQKESYFEASCHIPFLVSWPRKLPAGKRNDQLVLQTDLFGIATTAAGHPEMREGTDVLGVLEGRARPRDYLFGYYGTPGTPRFKIMVRHRDWKYIFIANGGREQLFNIREDPHELQNLMASHAEVAKQLHARAVAACNRPGAREALDRSQLRAFPFEKRRRERIYQFDRAKGVTGFPVNPEDMLKK